MKKYFLILCVSFSLYSMEEDGAYQDLDIRQAGSGDVVRMSMQMARMAQGMADMAKKSSSSKSGSRAEKELRSESVSLQQQKLAMREAELAMEFLKFLQGADGLPEAYQGEYQIRVKTMMDQGRYQALKLVHNHVNGMYVRSFPDKTVSSSSASRPSSSRGSGFGHKPNPFGISERE